MNEWGPRSPVMFIAFSLSRRQETIDYIHVDYM